MSSKQQAVKSEASPQVCYTCLSSDRSLSPLGILTNVLSILYENREIQTSQTYICWECKAILQKISRFKKKVNQVQEILGSFYYTQQNSSWKISPVSNLSIRRFDNDQIVECYHEQEITVKEDEIEKNGLVKKEETFSTLEFDQQPELKNELLELLEGNLNIKEELVSEDEWNTESIPEPEEIIESQTKRKKKQIGPLKLNYELVKSDLPFLKSKIKKVYITKDEIKDWMEKTRSHPLYWTYANKCESCLMFFKKKGFLDYHIAKVHKKDKSANLKCSICPFKTSTPSALKNHEKCHYTIRECTLCGYQTYPHKFMLKHMKNQHARIVKCNKCGQCYTNVRDLQQHYRDIHKKYVCDYCDKVCFKRRVIESHIMRNHLPQRCTVCDITFKNNKSLRSHNETKHSSLSSENAYCVECDKQLENKRAYKNHLLYSKAHAASRAEHHNARSSAACPECGKQYSRRTFMMNHFRYIHLKQTNYHCKECNKYFLNNTRLKDHLRVIHLGLKREKNKFCQYCNRGFSTNRILIKHIRTHTGERPYACPHCEAKFAQQEALQSHVKHIHLKIKRSAPAPAPIAAFM